MAMNDDRLHAYAHLGHDQVEGWLGFGALGMTYAIANHQARMGVSGAVGEIGVHHGRYFIALALMRSSGEIATAIDVFEDQHLNVDHSGSGNRHRFEQNILTHVGSMDGISVHKGDSLALHGEDLLALSNGQRYRLLSIDGGHTAVHALNDLRLASEVLHAQGIAVLDDFYNPDWPGVNEGYFRYASPTAALAPLAYGNNKLFLCRRAAHASWIAWLTSEVLPTTTYHKEVQLGGDRTFHIHPVSVERFVEQVPS